MLANALEFIKDQMEEYLSIKVDDSDLIRFSSLDNASGNASSQQPNKINITVVNIEEEQSMAHRSPHIKNENGIVKKNPPVYLNVYLLLSINFKDKYYLKGLRLLSLVLGFFQQHTVFNAAQDELPRDIAKLNFELVNVGIEHMSHFWGALGASYQPSVIYKMRMLPIDSHAIIKMETELRQPDIQGKL